MTENFNLSLLRLPEDTILLLDNINTAERLEQDAHRLRPDSLTIYFKDAERKCIICTKIRVRVVDDDSMIQYKDPFVGESEKWLQVPVSDVRHIEGHWYKTQTDREDVCALCGIVIQAWGRVCCDCLDTEIERHRASHVHESFRQF